MDRLTRQIGRTVRSRRAQILLPAVMLAPIFILVVYLLFETSKLSMTKVRQQFALDSGAYSQMSTASGYLNAMAQVNGSLPYRVMKTMNVVLPPKETAQNADEKLTVFDAFYTAGAFPAAGPNYQQGPSGSIANPPPVAESTDWGFRYYNGMREGWNKEDPKDDFDEEGRYVLTNEDIAENYFFGASGIGLTSIKEYATIFVRTGSIYASQKYSYQDTIKKSRIFRENYFLNTRDCRKADCGTQAAAILDQFELESTPFEIDKTRFYVTADYKGATMHSGAYAIDLNMQEIINAKLFQFAYLTPSARTRLRKLKRGITLKQKYTLPQNRFNINLTQRYNPYVKNSVSISCPRNNNNCVWPNPLPKYSVKVGI